MKPKIYTISEEKDFKLIAISSHLSDYKISWLLNQALKTKFQQSEDLLVVKIATQNVQSKFTTFKFEDEADIIYTLYSIRSDNDILLKSIKNIDYVIKFQGHISDTEIENILGKIKKLNNILTAFKIDFKELKNKEIELFF